MTKLLLAHLLKNVQIAFDRISQASEAMDCVLMGVKLIIRLPI